MISTNLANVLAAVEMLERRRDLHKSMIETEDSEEGKRRRQEHCVVADAGIEVLEDFVRRQNKTIFSKECDTAVGLSNYIANALAQHELYDGRKFRITIEVV